MAAYTIAQLLIHDRGLYERYVARVAETFVDFDAEVMVADDHPESVEGDWRCDRVVVIRFCNKQEAIRWSTSAAYRKIAGLRRAATTTTAVVVEGLS